MLRQQKDEFIEQMRRDVESAAGVLFVDYTGLKVSDVEALRRKYREAGVKYQVVKNTLMKRVLEGTSSEAASSCLKGTPTGVVIGFGDPVTAAKLTFEYAKDNAKLKIKGGIVENKAITPSQAEALSKLPSKAEVQGMVVAQAMSPGRNLVSQIKSPASRILGAILKLVENKENADQ